jgi:hypothetical protein
MIIRKKKRESMHTGRRGSTGGQKCDAKDTRKQITIQHFMYIDTTNV